MDDLTTERSFDVFIDLLTYGFLCFHFRFLSFPASSTLRHVFLDGTDKMTEQVWKRHTGEPVPYTNFHPLEGRDAGTQCASFDPYRNFMWSDLICNYPCRFICEIDIY